MICDRHSTPLLVAGDVFHTWNEPPEVVNTVMRAFEDTAVYGVPGQHDLPNHRVEDLGRSALGTLVEARRFELLDSEPTRLACGFEAFGFPWGTPVERPRGLGGGVLDIAVVHRFLWYGDRPFPGAAPAAHVDATADELERAGFAYGVFGDHHRNFAYTRECRGRDVTLYNCGPVVRRNVTEKDMQPSVGLLHVDGTITREYLDVSHEVWTADEGEGDAPAPPGVDAAELVDLLRKSADAVVSFRETVHAAAAEPGLPPGVRENLLRWVL